MASWMVHLRIADRLLEQCPGVCETEFIMGNIAPDSGVPNADWTAFSPPTSVSHFKTGAQKACPEAFAAKYFTQSLRATYHDKQYSFCLGYLTHLIVDQLWSRDIAQPSFRKFIGGEPPYCREMVWKIKDDWYGLDFQYLRKHPDFRAFRIYQDAVSFRNAFMEEFSADAFENRRQYITRFYQQGVGNADREFRYLTEAEMDAFVDRAAAEIFDILHTTYGLEL